MDFMLMSMHIYCCIITCCDCKHLKGGVCLLYVSKEQIQLHWSKATCTFSLKSARRAFFQHHGQQERCRPCNSPLNNKWNAWSCSAFQPICPHSMVLFKLFIVLQWPSGLRWWQPRNTTVVFWSACKNDARLLVCASCAPWSQACAPCTHDMVW